jgi:hypothetical protein
MYFDFLFGADKLFGGKCCLNIQGQNYSDPANRAIMFLRIFDIHLHDHTLSQFRSPYEYSLSSKPHVLLKLD